MLDSPNYQNEIANELTLDQCRKVVDQYAAYLEYNHLIGNVQLTGGDPLLKEGFWEIVSALRNRGVGIAVLGNPHFINHNTANSLYQAGVRFYQLSIDGTEKTHNYFRGEGSFEKTWKAVSILKQHGIAVGISSTISKINFSEIEGIIDLCEGYRVDAFRPTRLVPEGKGENYLNEVLSPLDYREILLNITRRLAALFSRTGTTIRFLNCDGLKIVPSLGYSGNFTPLYSRAAMTVRQGCHSRFLAVLPEGTVYPCRRLPVKVGNILEDSIEKLVNSNLVKKLRAPGSFTECRGCDYRNLCGGGCPAVTNALVGDPFKKDPQCWMNPDREAIDLASREDKQALRENILFQPLKIGSLITKNRVFRSATLEGVAEPDGSPNPEHSRIYGELTRGDCGLTITGIAYVSEDSKINLHENGIHQDSLISQWKKISDEVHQTGGKIVMQITHQSAKDWPFGGELIAPSTNVYWGPRGVVRSREMTEGEILKTIGQFKEAILRVEKAGFDGVQLQLAHDYLLGQFLSPLSNKRKDRWGGKLENRLRIIREILRAARMVIGKDFPVLVKINASDYAAGGLSFEEAAEAVGILAKSGVDAFELSGSVTRTPPHLQPCRTGNILDKNYECYFQREAEYIRKINPQVTLGVCGGIRSREKMEELIAKGFDFVSLSRPFIREPDLVKKLQRNKNYRVRCVSCSACFLRIKRFPLKCQLDNKI